MIVNRENLIRKLKNVYPFNQAEDDQLSLLVDKTDVVFYKKDDMVYAEGAGARYLYIIFEGEIEILKEQNQAIIRKNYLIEGDIFGEDIFLEKHVRQTSARAIVDCLLVRIKLPVISRYFQRVPNSCANFQPLIISYQLLVKNKQNLELGTEPVRYIGQPHKLFLVVKTVFFLLLLLTISAGIFSLESISVISGKTAWWITGVLVVLYLLWILWNIFEWANDLYIFTDRRVINQERGIFFYESREETPMDVIISLSSQVNVFGRQYKFGHLFIKTFTGSLRLKNVPRITETQHFLEFLIEKNRLSKHLGEKRDFENLVRNRFGFDNASGREVDGDGNELDQQEHVEGVSAGLFDRLFGIQRLDGDMVIYRTHWVFLVRKTLIPFFITLSLALIWMNLSVNGAEIINNQLILGFFIISCFISIVWWFYQYRDWRNDQYIITPEQIIDIYRKPLGMEDKRAALLENIQSIRYTRHGMLGLLLNFGTVFIKIGSEDFTFDNVSNPLRVQQTLFSYLEQADLFEKRADLAEQQRQIADWMDAYQRVSHERNRDDRQDKQDKLE